MRISANFPTAANTAQPATSAQADMATPSLALCAQQLGELATAAARPADLQAVTAGLDQLILTLQHHRDELARQSPHLEQGSAGIHRIDNPTLQKILTQLDPASLRAVRATHPALREAIDAEVRTLKPTAGTVDALVDMIQRFPAAERIDLSALDRDTLKIALPQLKTAPHLRELVLPQLKSRDCDEAFVYLAQCPRLERYSGTGNPMAELLFHNWVDRNDVFCVGGAALSALAGHSALTTLDDLRLRTPEDIRLLSQFPALKKVRVLIEGVHERHIMALADTLRSLPRNRALQLELYVKQKVILSDTTLARLKDALPPDCEAQLAVWPTRSERAPSKAWQNLVQHLRPEHKMVWTREVVCFPQSGSAAPQQHPG